MGLTQSLSSQLGLHPHTNHPPPQLGSHWGTPVPAPPRHPPQTVNRDPKRVSGASKRLWGRSELGTLPTSPALCEAHLASLTRGNTAQCFPPHLGPRSASQTRPHSADSASGFKSCPGLAPSLTAVGSRAPGFTSLNLSITGKWVGAGGAVAVRVLGGAGWVRRRPAAPRSLSPQLRCPDRSRAHV